MPLSRSAHVDTFARDGLPPSDQWPQFLFDLPDVRYPDRLNSAQRLIDDISDRLGADRRCLVTPSESWTYGRLRDRSDRVASVLAGQLGLQPGNRCCSGLPTTRGSSPPGSAYWPAVSSC